MGGLFSSRRKSERQSESAPKKNRIDDTDVAVLDLKAQQDQLTIHKRKLEALVPKDEEAARKLMRDKRDKKLILLALKKKKHHISLIDDTDGHILRLQEMISNIEMQRVQADVVKALSSGVGAMKILQKECSSDYVAQLMDENADQQAMVEEIGQLLGAAGINDVDVDADYAAIEAALELEAAADTIEKMPVAPVDLPDVAPTVATTEPEVATNAESPKQERQAELA